GATLSAEFGVRGAESTDGLSIDLLDGTTYRKHRSLRKGEGRANVRDGRDRQQERARDRPEAGDSLPKPAAPQPLLRAPAPEPDLEERAGELITRKGPADLAAQRHLDARAVAIAPTESWWESPPTTARTRRSCSRRSAPDVAGRASSVVIGQMPWTSAIAALR